MSKVLLQCLEPVVKKTHYQHLSQPSSAYIMCATSKFKVEPRVWGLTIGPDTFDSFLWTLDFSILATVSMITPVTSKLSRRHLQFWSGQFKQCFLKLPRKADITIHYITSGLNPQPHSCSLLARWAIWSDTWKLHFLEPLSLRWGCWTSQSTEPHESPTSDLSISLATHRSALRCV